MSSELTAILDGHRSSDIGHDVGWLGYKQDLAGRFSAFELAMRLGGLGEGECRADPNFEGAGGNLFQDIVGSLEEFLARACVVRKGGTSQK